MYVTPPWRGRELGRLVSAEVVGWARERGLRQALLHVADWNEPARRAYEALGFVATGVTQPLPHDPSVNELEMRLDLESQ